MKTIIYQEIRKKQPPVIPNYLGFLKDALIYFQINLSGHFLNNAEATG